MRYKTLLNLNWINGQFDLEDSSGSIFKISSTGESTVTNPELKSHIYAKPMNFPVGKNLSALVDGTVEMPSHISGNIPRLFAVRKDGSGTELLRDESIVEFFKGSLKENQTEVIEEALSEPKDAISFVTIQPLKFAKSVVKNLLYRQVIQLFNVRLLDFHL